jgi:hypothetical protein
MNLFIEINVENQQKNKALNEKRLQKQSYDEIIHHSSVQCAANFSI